MRRKRAVLSLLAVVLLPAAFVLSTPPARAQEDGSTLHGHDAFGWTSGYSLIVTDHATLEAADEAIDYINSNGGQVAIVVSPRLMLGWVPAGLAKGAGIRSVHRNAVTGRALRSRNADETDAVAFFNQVASGAWQQSKQGLSEHDRVVDYPADAFEGPAATGGFLGNGPGIPGSPSPGNADMMVGRANFNAIFVESIGGVDPNTHTWTCANVSTIVSEISASLSFWSSRAFTYGVPLSWVASYHRPPQCSGGTTRVRTSYEPITRSSGDDGLWISQIMCNFGFCSGDKFTRTNAFNSARRTATRTNWATTSFIGYNPSPAPTTFTDGFFAYAYRGGFYSQLLFRNDGWAISQYDLVNAHETGHLFGTFDEYASSGCNNCFTSDTLSKSVVNGNCQNCASPSVACIQRNNELSLCGYTPGQVGWGLDINFARSTTTANVEKTNYVPGQAVRYLVNVDVPGRTGECITVRSRWYRQFQTNRTQAESFVTPCLIRSGASWNIFLDRTVPSNAQYGEAAFEVQLEFAYATAPNVYGRGIRGSSRGRFFVLLGGANPIPTSPENDVDFETAEELTAPVGDGPQAEPVEPPQP